MIHLFLISDNLPSRTRSLEPLSIILSLPLLPSCVFWPHHYYWSPWTYLTPQPPPSNPSLFPSTSVSPTTFLPLNIYSTYSSFSAGALDANPFHSTKIPFLLWPNIFLLPECDLLEFFHTLVLYLTTFHFLCLGIFSLEASQAGHWGRWCWLVLRGWKELLVLAKVMSSSKKLMTEMDELMEGSKNLSWEDVSGSWKWIMIEQKMWSL